jgi:hypothetical protein
VPNGEAEEYASNSLLALQAKWTPPAHAAHLVVMSHPAPNVAPLANLSRFTSLLAAVVKASGAIAVYWGNAGATHPAEAFLQTASDPGVMPRIVLWSGVSIAREKDGRLSLLSLGMEQLGLPNLLLAAGSASTGEALECMYDLLAYVAQRGKPLPEGDTVGRSAEDRLPVHYVKSPVDPRKHVWRVEMP